MGLIKTLGLTAVVAGTTLAIVKYPEESREQILRAYRASAKALSDFSEKNKDTLRDLQQPYPVQVESELEIESESSNLHWNGHEIPNAYSDGKRIESWNYRGNVWPDEWKKMNEDGSFNGDYVRWLREQNRR